MKVPGYLEGRFRPRLGEVHSQKADREVINIISSAFPASKLLEINKDFFLRNCCGSDPMILYLCSVL